MNQENKFGEYKQKLLQYWAVFLAACGKAWIFVKENSKVLLQKLAAWLVKAKDWLGAVTASARVKGKALLERLALWLMAVKEKIRPAVRQAGLWCKTQTARLKSSKLAGTIRSIAAPKQQELTALLAEAPAAAEAAAEVPVQKALPEEVPAAEEMEEKVPAKQAVKNFADAFPQITNPYLRKALVVLGAIGIGSRFTIKWIWKLRTVFMAIPVIWAAVKLAMQNMERLPEKVGLDIQATGEFARMITREEAVYWPLGITLFCLLLMFTAKKPVLPWVISIFTLVLPWMIWILNYYA